MRLPVKSGEQLREQKQRMSYHSSRTFSASSSTGDPRKLHHTRRRSSVAFRGMIVLISCWVFACWRNLELIEV